MIRLLNSLTILAGAYLLGGVNPAYIKSRRNGFDIRNTGTGNAGASNAVLSFGKKAGALIALADIFKAYFIIKLSALLFPAMRLAKELAGTGCMIGHMLPVQLRFRGGKGLACLGGVVLAFSPKCFLLMLALELLLALVVGYLSIIPITASAAFLIVYLCCGGSWAGFALYLSAVLIMEIKHMENLRRIRAGTEIRVNYLWNKEQELLRIQKNSENTDSQHNGHSG